MIGTAKAQKTANRNLFMGAENKGSNRGGQCKSRQVADATALILLFAF
jgi:hypothetical protein